ncbi:MaoC family dehydratase [Sphingorhabdus sp. Alg239-R122]|uniref:MaoC family dehydratase n=1 Tax=Sphingorhabdus sp. Alg239-R122 TaxID=2305989 RepID=UPI0013DA6794|nr:MaoC family dehydratase [Sphingorhabdus sp. Alg239-R122]
MIYFEDIEVGTTQSFGSYEVTREEVIDFASKYDPQPFHLNDEAAAQTYFGRLSASGWHTCAMTMRMLVDSMMERKAASLGSPGVDKVRWLQPVYPGDTLRVESEVLSKRQSESKPQMGSFQSEMTVYNQNNEPVMTMVSIALMRVRADAA